MDNKRDLTVTELNELAVKQERYWHRLGRERVSRRSVLQTVSKLGIGAAGLALVGCGDDDDDDSAPAASQAQGQAQQQQAQAQQQAQQTAEQADAQQAQAEAVEEVVAASPYDTLLTEEQYAQVLANVPEAQKAFPFLDQYNWRRLDWNSPPYVGGTIESFGIPPLNFDLMTTETLTEFPIYMNGLYYSAMHRGVNLDIAAVRPDLARTTEANADFTEWVFTIPDNAFFHDIPPVNGAQLTAEHVKFSFDRYIDTSVWNVPLKDVASIEAVDDTTVKFTMSRPTPQFPRVLAMPYFMVFHPDHFEDRDRFSEIVIGTGAWQITSNEPFTRSTAVRHPQSWAKSEWLPGNPDITLPFPDAMNHTFIPDPNALDAALRGEEIDLWSGSGIRPQRVLDLLDTNPDLQVSTNLQWGLTHWRAFPQHNNPIYADERVRRALSMAVNRQEMVDIILDGGGNAQATPMPFDQMGMQGPPTPDQMGQWWAFDPDGAKALLEEAGHGDGFNMTVLTSALGGGALPDWIPLVQQYWGNIGINVTVETRENLQLSATLLQKDFSDMIFTDGLGSILAYDLPQLVTVYRPGSPQNFGNWDIPAINEVIGEIDNNLDPDAWESLAFKFHETWAEWVPTIYFAGYHNWKVIQPWMHTVANTGYTTILNYASENWRAVWMDDTAPGGRGGTLV